MTALTVNQGVVRSSRTGAANKNHRVIFGDFLCGRSSSGRAPPCQGGGSEFEPRRPLHLATAPQKQSLLRGCFVFSKTGLESCRSACYNKGNTA